MACTPTTNVARGHGCGNGGRDIRGGWGRGSGPDGPETDATAQAATKQNKLIKSSSINKNTMTQASHSEKGVPKKCAASLASVRALGPSKTQKRTV